MCTYTYLPIRVFAKMKFFHLFKIATWTKFCSFIRVQCSFVLGIGIVLHIFCTIFVAQLKMGFSKDSKKEQLDFMIPFVQLLT